MFSDLGAAGVICSLPGLVALPSLVCMRLGQPLLARGTCCWDLLLLQATLGGG